MHLVEEGLRRSGWVPLGGGWPELGPSCDRYNCKGWQLGKGKAEEGVQCSARLMGGKDVGVPRTSTLERKIEQSSMHITKEKVQVQSTIIEPFLGCWNGTFEGTKWGRRQRQWQEWCALTRH